MVVLLLVKEIISLFIILLAGVLMVRCGILTSGDSKILSVLSIYLIMPCVIVSAFQTEQTKEVKAGLLLAVCAAILSHVILVAVTTVLKHSIKLDAVEQVSIVYSNAGNLIIPLVSAVLGSQWIIYISAYVAVQLVFLWSHGRTVLCGEKAISIKKIILNANMIAVFLGVVLFISEIRFPTSFQTAIDSVASMAGPAAMLMTGILIGGMSFKLLLSYRRVWLIAALRLIVSPLIILAIIKVSGAEYFIANGHQIMLVVLLATMTPSASTITQMAQLYGKDANYAGVINVVTTLLCMISMPCLVTLFQSF